ncbi:MAG: hypothetical protein H6658_20685 [Ardenticatenaceae bacterium]|nr:hypothetical protein [Ardenticatenaceae bacterium]
MRDANKGYLLPDNVSPEDMLCLKVFIPNEPRYLEAFSGQYHDLGTWLAWEKDNTNRAALAAAAWKSAIDYTYENGWLNCGESMECCEEILNRLTNIETLIGGLDMTVTVNNCISCGCGGGCGCNNGDYPWGNDPAQDPLPTPPSTDPTYPNEADPAGWCDRVTEIVSRYVVVFQTLQEWWGGINGTATAIISWIDYYFGSLGVASPIIVAALSAALSFVLTNSLVERLRTVAENAKDALICALIPTESPAESKSAFEAELSQQYAGESLPVRTLMKAVALVIDWNKVHDLEGIPTSPEYVGSSCDDCDSGGGGGGSPTPDWPDEPEPSASIEWRVGTIAESEEDQFTVRLDLQADGWLYEAYIPTSSSTWSPNILCSPPTLAPGESIVGFTYLVYDNMTDGGINDPTNGTVRIAGRSDNIPPWRRLFYLTDYDDELLPTADYDLSEEVNQTEMDEPKSIEHYARIGISGTPPGTAYVDVRAVLWAILLP